MRRLLCLLSACFLTAGSLRAQTPTPADAVPAETPGERCTALLKEAHLLQQRQRFFDALTKLEEAEKIDPARSDIFNTRGAIYLSSQMRDFDKARAAFNKALEYRAQEPEPGNDFNIRFNLAEADLVQGRFADGEKSFGGLLEKFPKLPTSMRHFVVFQQIVCQMKQDKLTQAGQLMKDNFTFMDDSPAYYFSKAVQALQQKDQKTGNEWLRKGQLIFKKTETSPYIDTLTEAGYLTSMAVAKPTEEDEKDK